MGRWRAATAPGRRCLAPREPWPDRLGDHMNALKSSVRYPLLLLYPLRYVNLKIRDISFATIIPIKVCEP